MSHIFKGVFIVSDAHGKPDHTTISYQRKTSIESFLKGSTLEWKQAYLFGCRCKKYDVEITLSQRPKI